MFTLGKFHFYSMNCIQIVCKIGRMEMICIQVGPSIVINMTIRAISFGARVDADALF